MQFQVIKAGSARAADGLRDRRDPRERGDDRGRTAARSRRGGAISRVLQARRFLRQEHRDLPDHRACAAARPSASCWSASGRSPASGGRPTAARSSRRRNGSRRAAPRMRCPGSRRTPCPGLDARLRRAPRRRERQQRALPHPGPQDGEEAAAAEARALRHRRGGRRRRAAERGVRDGRGIAAGMAFMKDLANLPANVCTPSLPRRCRARPRQGAQDRARARARRARDPPPRHGLVPLGDARLGRAAAAHRARVPRRQEGDAPVALVGKGITFDTGGISLKQPPGMDEMKFDMSGAASVFGTFKALATIGAPHQRRRHHPDLREHAGRPRDEAGRHRHLDGRQDHRGAEHRRRGPADPLRRHHLLRAASSRAPWSTSRR